ncbi:DNA repair protein REV1 isoform X4 [Manihot esculenta]|uniref:DNA repair protein REV1 isoform X4 n=1 Tax=Manihot esculenta TaxID=3983 RepID=UPI001CC6E974|nr:DNA repair protein REV1 isoform X4 [Manihot esculenta]
MSRESSRSANSGQRSKRSFNNSSYSNNSNSSNKKTKTTNQKTLGMAWGANSLSSSRSSFRTSPFSDFGSYMVEKNRKLQNQFNAEASSSSHGGSSSEKPIFDGVSIFVDGFTIPSSQALRGYMLKYGGRFENYFSRHRVTHIICCNLPNSKIKNLRSFSGGLPVVKPAWILDSVAASKLLSWVPYQLEQLANNQPKVSAFFAAQNRLVAEDALNIMDPSLKGGTLAGVPVKDGEQINRQFEDRDCQIEEPSSSSGKSSEVRMAEPINTEDGSSISNELPSSPSQFSVSVKDNQNESKSPAPSIAGPSNPHHSTIEDPNFVENYFKSSRLHFIGTWRNRYRKRFCHLPNEFSCRSVSTANASDNSQKTTIIHVDMDCFFVSVVIRNDPELHDKPVAVCHSDNPKGTAEISSANYPAREYGVKAGIFVRDAKAICPHLIIFPYNFQAYEEVADQFYNVLHKHCNKVQAVSCDEAFVDITDLGEKDPEVLASTIRKEIFETTGCKASAGIAGNMLMARLATRTAKPDGQCYVPPERVDEYLQELPIKALPGIGYVLEEKLKKKNISTCGQLRLISKDSLQKDFGKKTGEMLWNYSRGIDNRLVGVIQENKSVGAEVNWGVRFKDLQDSQNFLLKLCEEVSLRLRGCGVQGRTFTLKIKKRRKDALEPIKYMGCGDCENLSRSITVPVSTDDVDVLQRITKQLFGSFHLGLERKSLRSWLTSASATTGGQDSISNISNETSNIVPPPLYDLDMEVIECLPPELFSELNQIYGGKLVEFIAQSKGKSENSRNSPCIPYHEVKATTGCGERPLASTFIPNMVQVENMAKQHISEEAPSAPPFSGAGSNNGAIRSSGLLNIDLMPSSLSQVDTSVLQQLPEELRADILELLPAHGRRESISASSFVPLMENAQEPLVVAENQSVSVNSVVDCDLWSGNPPQWVDKFKVSNCLILSTLADTYYKLGSTGNLSSMLQHTISDYLYKMDESDDSWDDEATHNLCEILKQYIALKIEFDIEEIYVCFRLLKRHLLENIMEEVCIFHTSSASFDGILCAIIFIFSSLNKILL